MRRWDIRADDNGGSYTLLVPPYKEIGMNGMVGREELAKRISFCKGKTTNPKYHGEFGMNQYRSE